MFSLSSYEGTPAWRSSPKAWTAVTSANPSTTPTGPVARVRSVTGRPLLTPAVVSIVFLIIYRLPSLVNRGGPGTCGGARRPRRGSRRAEFFRDLHAGQFGAPSAMRTGPVARARGAAGLRLLTPAVVSIVFFIICLLPSLVDRDALRTCGGVRLSRGRSQKAGARRHPLQIRADRLRIGIHRVDVTRQPELLLDKAGVLDLAPPHLVLGRPAIAASLE